MRSVHGPVFNHDDGANGYDADVRNEKDPIRAAYHDVLAWVISEARIDSFSRVLELGSGTGNLSCFLDRCGELVSSIDVANWSVSIYLSGWKRSRVPSQVTS